MMSGLNVKGKNASQSSCGGRGQLFVDRFQPFDQWACNFSNPNPACSANTSHALAGRGREIILPDLPASPLYDAVVLSLTHPSDLFGSSVLQNDETMEDKECRTRKSVNRTRREKTK